MPERSGYTGAAVTLGLAALFILLFGLAALERGADRPSPDLVERSDR